MESENIDAPKLKTQYKKEFLDSFKFKFNGIERIEQNYSQAYQDMFVLSVLDGKQNGTFLEIGSYDPLVLSNTYLLESQFNWNGISIDINKLNIDKMVSFQRKCQCLCKDATKTNYFDLLKEYNRIDYLSLDIEPNIQTLSCLCSILATKCRFSVITFETDVYAGTDDINNSSVKAISRKLLELNEYVLVNGNVSGFGDDEHPFEDWYIDKAINCWVIEKFKRENDNPLAGHKYFYE